MTAKPICARCGRPVDTFIESHDPFTGIVRFTALCHGGMDMVAFTEDELRDVGSITISVAFRSVRGLAP